MTTFPQPVDMKARFLNFKRQHAKLFIDATGQSHMMNQCEINEQMRFHEYLLKDVIGIVEQLQVDNKVSKQLIGSLRIKNAELELKLKGTEERVDTLLAKGQKDEDIKKLEERYEALKIEMKEIENDLKFYGKVVEK